MYIFEEKPEDGKQRLDLEKAISNQLISHFSINIIYSIISIIVLTAGRQRSKVLIIKSVRELNCEKRLAIETAEEEER